MNLSGRKLSLLVLLTLSFVTLPWIGNIDFYTRGEPREALVAQSMFATRHFAAPTAYGGEVPSKPPFIHWMMVGVSTLTGQVSEFEARLPSSLAYIFFGMSFFFFLRKQYGEEHALLAVFILSSSFEWYRSATGARVDMVLATASAGGLLSFWQWQDAGRRGLPVVAVTLFAIACLTKGPIGVVLPGLAWLVFGLIRRMPFWRIALDGVCFFVPALLPYFAWLLAAASEQGSSVWAMVIDENFSRLVGDMKDGTPHKSSAPLLWLTLISGFMPLSVWMCAASVRNLPLWRIPQLFYRKTYASWHAQLTKSTSFTVLSWAALSMTIFFYSIPEGKRSVYLLLAYPFAAHLLTNWMLPILKVAQPAASLRRYARCLSLFCLSSFIFLALLLDNIGTARKFAAESPIAATLYIYATALSQRVSELSICSWLLLLVTMGAAIGQMMPQLEKHLRRPLLILGAPLLICFVAVLQDFPVVAVSRVGSERKVARQIGGFLNPSTPLYSFAFEFYGTSFYLQKQISSLKASDFVEGNVVLLKERDLAELKQGLSATLTASQLTISDYGVVQPRDRALLVKIVSKEG